LNTDILIIGGGMAGLLCAHALRQADADIILIEANRIVCGVTKNTTAKITSQHGLIYHKLLRNFGLDAARGYWELNEEALSQYRHMAKEIDCDFSSRDNYIYSSYDTNTLRKELKALKQLQIPGELTKCDVLPFEAAGAIRFRNQAQFHPLKFVSGIAKNLRIFEYTEAREFVGNTVMTNRGRIRANQIILATHFPILNKHGLYYMKLHQDRSYVLGLEGAKAPEGMYLGEGKRGLSFRQQGNILLLGGGSHRTGKPSAGWEGLEAAARQYYPNAKIRYRWATQDCMSLDEIPYVGQYSAATPDLYVATGFNKWGMTGAMVSAILLSRELMGNPHPLAWIYDPSRSMLHPNLAVNALESAWNLIRPRAPRCPHLGCALNWNPQERSWDCACHGSRFSESGELLNNPATGDLRKKPPRR